MLAAVPTVAVDAPACGPTRKGWGSRFHAKASAAQVLRTFALHGNSRPPPLASATACCTGGLLPFDQQGDAAILAGNHRLLGVAITPNGDFAYVTNDPSGVAVIKTSTDAVVANVPVGNQPAGVAITPNGGFAYVANTAGDATGRLAGTTVSVINTVTNTVVTTATVGRDPTGVAITPNGAFAYVTNQLDGTVSVINTSTNAVVATVAVGTDPGRIAITPNGALAYVANEASTMGGQSVSVIDTSSNTVVATVPVGGQAEGVAVTPDGSYAYVATNGGTVAVINTSTNTVVATVPVVNDPVAVALTPNGSFAYVLGGSSVSAIKTATNSVVATVGGVGGGTGAGLAITPPITPAGPAPKNIRAPKIKGRAKYQRELKATTGKWRGTPRVFRYRWKACNKKGRKCKAIPGEIGTRYVIGKKQRGRRLKVVVVATNRLGRAKAASKPTAVVNHG